ncbi:MAG: uroporphyrinogen-III C-methyltransferase [Bacteriovoracaceae bacterium]|nr:uroporphyrinogen-III C-methyltransferase [Bacteriovoracaceae bacterium]
MNNSKVFLVGAGPGSLDLLTLKAYQLLKTADVIVYDRLVSNEIMDEINPNAHLHYVGKQESEHTIPQDEINKLLVHYAHKYKKIVRLKGGDPFVFGRGGEEIVELVKNNIAFEVVPGISSSVSALTYAGIPITHRGVSNNFLVMTGHTCNTDGLDLVPWSNLQSVGTIVILMGVRNKSFIAQKLIEGGKPSKTPVAFIERATRHDQKVITSTLFEVANKEIFVESPAVFVVGETVQFHHQWNWFLKEESLEGLGVSVGI